MPPTMHQNALNQSAVFNLRDNVSPHGSYKSSSPSPAENHTSYFPHYGLRSAAQTPPPSDSLSASMCLNPDDRFLRSQSSGLSMQSSDRSSITSSSYLTPPEFPLDTDAPPYKPRRRNSNSLTMLKKKSKTSPPDQRRQNNKSRSGHAERKSLKDKEKSWRRKSSSSLEAIHKYVCPGKRKVQPKTKDEILRSLYSGPAAPIETRRWSSVEIGAIPLSSSRSVAHSVLSDDSKRSSIYDMNSPKEDVIEAIRAKLMARKVPSTHIDTPATITLRKASGASSYGSSNQVSPPGSIPSPRDSSSKVWRSNDERRPSAYLITSAEIDSIARLIEANIKRSRPTQQIHTPDKLDLQPQISARRPSVCKDFISVHDPVPADIATTLSDVHAEYAKSKDGDTTPTPRRTSSGVSISKIHSARSVHEIIWDGHTSRPKLKSVMSTSTTEGFSYERTYSMYDQSTPGDYSPGVSWTTKITSSGAKNDHLSPLATPMVETSFEWSESKPREPNDDDSPRADDSNLQADHSTPKAVSQYSETNTTNQNPAIPVIVTEEDSKSERSSSQPGSRATSTYKGCKGKVSPRPGLHRRAERIQNPFISAVTNQLDVISFPALPQRAKTSDWISPLPDISAPIGASEKHDTRKTLYNLGLDITQSSLATVGNDRKLSHDLKMACTPLSLRSAESLTWDIGLARHCGSENPDLKTRRKSVVLQHPASDLWNNDSSSKTGMGQAIGVSSGRRKSSGYPLKIRPDDSTSPEQKSSRKGSDSIVKALVGSKSETDFKRKSLSKHGTGRRVKIMADPDGERACIDHSGLKKMGCGIWKDKLRGKADDVGFKMMQSGSGFMNMVNNTIPGGVPTRLTSPHSPHSAPAQLSATSFYPFPLSCSSVSSPNSANPKSDSHFKNLPSSSSYPAVPQSSVALKTTQSSSQIPSPKISKMSVSADRLHLIEQKCPATVQEDCVGIYITMTGTRRGGEGLVGNSNCDGEAATLCSAECENHSCHDGGDGVDWIG